MSSPVPFDNAVTLLTAASLGYPMSVPNTTFVRPEPPAPWFRVDSVSHSLAPIELGGGGWQEEGTLYIDVFVPLGSGYSTARTLAKAITNVFRQAPLGDVHYMSTAIGTGGVIQPNGNWWCLTVSVDFKYQDVSI